MLSETETEFWELNLCIYRTIFENKFSHSYYLQHDELYHKYKQLSPKSWFRISDAGSLALNDVLSCCFWHLVQLFDEYSFAFQLWINPTTFPCTGRLKQTASSNWCFQIHDLARSYFLNIDYNYLQCYSSACTQLPFLNKLYSTYAASASRSGNYYIGKK